MAESYIKLKIDSDLKNKYKGRLLEFCDGRTMQEDLLEYIKQKTWFLDPKPSDPSSGDPEPETVEPAPDSEPDKLAALEREYVRLEGCEDEISGIYVEEFGYVEPHEPEYPEALRKKVEELRVEKAGNEDSDPETEPETAENRDSKPKTHPPEDPNESFGFPDDEPAATVEPDGDIPPRASLPLPLDPEDEPDPGVEPEAEPGDVD